MPPRPDSAAVAGGPPSPARVRRARRARARRRWTTIALFLAPALVLYGLLVIAPDPAGDRTTAASSGTGSATLDDFVGLDNFKRAFGDDVFTGALRHNGVFVVLSPGDPAAVRARRSR